MCKTHKFARVGTSWHLHKTCLFKVHKCACFHCFPMCRYVCYANWHVFALPCVAPLEPTTMLPCSIDCTPPLQPKSPACNNACAVCFAMPHKSLLPGGAVFPVSLLADVPLFVTAAWRTVPTCERRNVHADPHRADKPLGSARPPPMRAAMLHKKKHMLWLDHETSVFPSR